MNWDRREFLTDVGRGMLVAIVGSATVQDLGFGTVRAGEDGEALRFGMLENLVGLMEDTPADKILPLVCKKLQEGMELKQVLAGAALANARAFGGEDYVGFHTMMAMTPAYYMSKELPKEKQALPIMKVIHRNSRRLNETGGSKAEVLKTVRPGTVPSDQPAGEAIRDAVRRKDLVTAERTFAAVASASAEEAFNHLLTEVEDATEVHRVVLPYRAWDMLSLIGKEYAHALLRQSLRYCVKAESPRYNESFAEPRTILPKLIDQYHLLSKPTGSRQADDKWIAEMCGTIFRSSPAQAAEAAAAALAEGMAPDAIAEATCLATNQLVLRDSGRRQRETSAGKPVGSVHGDSIGVHACDSANAWRNMAKVSNLRNQVACIILGAYQAAQDRIARGGDFQNWKPRPLAADLERVKATEPTTLLREAEDAIRNKDQGRVTAVVGRYGILGHAARPMFDLLLRYAISEDGALHAEKYYRTATQEFELGRPAFRWRQVVALARVTASACGQPAPGYEEACRLVSA